jgi:D-tyrosyl-tRNA(Tyr) deacylase
MKIVIQRVRKSYVKVNDQIVSEIGKGLNILVGFGNEDKGGNVLNKLNKAVEKIINLRIFEDSNGKMNLSVMDVDGEILVVSQFTLYGDVLKGRRPSFDRSLNKEEAKKLYDEFVKLLKENYPKVKEGIFSAKMEVGIINDGPVTFILEL